MARSLSNIARVMKVWREMKSWRLTIVLISGLLGMLCNVAVSQNPPPPDMPHPRVGMASARIGSTLFLIGGGAPPVQALHGSDELESLVGTPTVDAFDFSNHNWITNIPPLNTPRVFATAVALDDSIYVMGGTDDKGRILSSVEVYDPATNQWHYASSMLDRRKGAASVVYNDSIIVFGGAGDVGLHRTVEVYSPATGAWTVADTLVWGRAFHHAVKIGKYIYVFGGIGSILGTVVGPIRYIERYDPVNGAAQIGLAWGEPRAFFGVIVKDDSVFAISGYGSTTNDGFYGDVDLLNFGVYGNEVESVQPKILLNLPRAGFVADLGNDGRIYMFGGYSPDYKGGLLPVPPVEVIPPFGATPVIENQNTNPEDFSISQNFPNPFNPTTTIEFQVPPPGGEVSLKVFNMLGQKVGTLVQEYLKSGKHTVVFGGENLPSGTYIYRLQVGNEILCRKMVMIK